MSAPLSDARALVDYAKSLDCIHCGLCLQSCPTYRVTGVETSSPRGRIHLMRAVGEGRLAPDADYAEELDFCLLCRHCESVCPAGVRFGQMMETARAGLGPRGGWRARLGLGLVLRHRLALRAAGSLLRLAQKTGLDGLGARLFGADPETVRALPRIPALRERALLPPRADAAAGVPPRGEVALLEGCVQPELFARVNRATLRSLAALGLASRVPRLPCCGSLHAHAGEREGARALARGLIEALERERDAQGEPLLLVVNSAGCGSHLKELEQLFAPDDPWHARARAAAARVRDYAELVLPLVLERAPALPEGLFPAPFAWDDPCHLCHGQGIRREPRAILERLLGARLVAMDDAEACCGSAGTYSLARPEDAARVFARKRESFERCGARTLVTANPGCQLQWESGLRRAGREARVVHLAELVAAALDA